MRNKLSKKSRPRSVSASVRNGRKGGMITSLRIQFARQAEQAGIDITKPFKEVFAAHTSGGGIAAR